MRRVSSWSAPAREAEVGTAMVAAEMHCAAPAKMHFATMDRGSCSAMATAADTQGRSAAVASAATEVHGRAATAMASASAPTVSATGLSKREGRHRDGEEGGTESH